VISIKVSTPGRYNFGARGEKETLVHPGTVELTYDGDNIAPDTVFLIEVKLDTEALPRQLAFTREQFDAFQYAFSKVFAR